MSDDKLKEFMKSQIEEINKHKWIESEKACRDLGKQAVQDWINKYAKLFRQEWNEKH